MLRRVAGDRRDRDAGVTLIEVLVGMGLLMIVMTLAMNFFIGTGQEASRVTGQTLTAADGRTALNQVATLLRLADTPTPQAGYADSRFTVVSASEVTFFANVAPGSRSGTAPRTPPALVDLTIANGQLIEKLYAPITNNYGSGSSQSSYNYTTNYCAYSSQSSCTPQAVRTVLLSSLDTSKSSGFTYCTSATDPTVSCTTAATPAAVAAVGVTLYLKGLAGENGQAVQTMIAITGATS